MVRMWLVDGRFVGLGARGILDLDSAEIPLFGEQEQSAYNGHFESTRYRSLLFFSREGDVFFPFGS